MSDVNHEQRKHALLSASGSARWLNCTASARLEEGFRESETSSYAAEGTLAHEFGDLGLQFLSGILTEEQYRPVVDALYKHELFKPEMTDFVKEYCEYVMSQFKHMSAGSVLLIEERVDLTEFIPEGFGSCDAILIGDGVMEVIDLKYGKGLAVSAEENSQLMLYGLGALAAYDLMYDIDTVRLTVHQPRLDSVDSWDIQADTLRDWGETVVKTKAKMAWEGEGAVCTGSWCRWCKASVKCKSIRDKIIKAQKLAEEHPELSHELISDEEMIEMLKLKPIIDNWFNRVSEYMLDEALNGYEWDDYKVVQGVSRRKWVDEPDLIKLLRKNKLAKKDFFINKLDSITTVEKRLGKGSCNDLTVKPPGKLTLVPMSDKRQPAELSSAASDFF